VPEPDSVVDNFTGISTAVVSERTESGGVSVFFTADVIVPDPLASIGNDPLISQGEDEGLDDDTVIEERTRAELEFGYSLTFGGAVPAMLSGFECEMTNDGVQISWHLSGQSDPSRIALQAQSGGRTWDVPFERVVGGNFRAVDRGAAGGEVFYTLLIEDSNGDYLVLGEGSVSLETPTAGVKLHGAYPNPFNPETKITFRVGSAQHVQVAIFDLRGKRVSVLADQTFDIGLHQVVWTGRDQNGTAVPSGTYFARTISDLGVQTTKLMLVK